MNLYEYIQLTEEGTEVTVTDSVYDTESYFYNNETTADLWDKSMMEFAKLLTVKQINPNGAVSVDMSTIIENHINDLEKANLFIECEIESIMDDIDNIISGDVSEEWLAQFVEVLKE